MTTATDPTPCLAEPAVPDHRDTPGFRQFCILMLLARGVRIHEAGPWLRAQVRWRL